MLHQIIVSFLSELYSRKLLDKYLSRALGLELEDGRLTLIDSSAYVLTIDYTIKMLNIHERSVYTCTLFVVRINGYFAHVSIM